MLSLDLIFSESNSRKNNKKIRTNNARSEYFSPSDYNSNFCYYNQNLEVERPTTTTTGQGHGIDTVAATLHKALKLDTAMILLQQTQVFLTFTYNYDYHN